MKTTHVRVDALRPGDFVVAARAEVTGIDRFAGLVIVEFADGTATAPIPEREDPEDFMTKPDWMVHPCSLTTQEFKKDYKVVYADRQYLSFYCSDYSYTGGAHGSTTIIVGAIDRKTGARGLRSIMEGILLETMYELPNLEDVSEVVISADVVVGKAKPIYVYGERLDDTGTGA